MQRVFHRAGIIIRAKQLRLIDVRAIGYLQLTRSIPRLAVTTIGVGVMGLSGAYLGNCVLLDDGYHRKEELKEAITDILENYDYDDGSIGPVLVRLA